MIKQYSMVLPGKVIYLFDLLSASIKNGQAGIVQMARGSDACCGNDRIGKERNNSLG